MDSVQESLHDFRSGLKWGREKESYVKDSSLCEASVKDSAGHIQKGGVLPILNQSGLVSEMVLPPDLGLLPGCFQIIPCLPGLEETQKEQICLTLKLCSRAKQQRDL